MRSSSKTFDRHTAVILEHSHVTAVELTHSAKGFVLTAAGSFQAQTNFDTPAGEQSERGIRQREKAFAGELGTFFKKIGASSRHISFGLNTGMLMLQTVPMDESLDDRQRAEQALWELKNFDIDSTERSHALITHRLAGDTAQPDTARVVIVGVRKSFVSFLTNTAAILSSKLAIVDVQHFCAENALIANYGQDAAVKTLLIGMDDHALNASTLEHGQPIDVQVRSFSGDDTRMIFDIVRSSGAEKIFLHGSGASYQMCETIQRTLEVPVALIDPFKSVLLPASLKGLADIKARRHEFTAAIGLAMRTE
ncbi:MAG TPA: hypothetical protein VK470_17040 [Bacteroidota bacterium]|nr:hypothetical protein [Bacteroidota bacterium]